MVSTLWVVPKLRWPNIVHYLPLLTLHCALVREFLYCYKGKSEFRWHFQYLPFLVNIVKERPLGQKVILPLKLPLVHCSLSSKWASPPKTGKKAWARVPPDPSKGSPSPCSPLRKLMSIWTFPLLFWVNDKSVCSDQTSNAFAISPSTSRLVISRVVGYWLILYVRSLTRHLLPEIKGNYGINLRWLNYKGKYQPMKWLGGKYMLK